MQENKEIVNPYEYGYSPDVMTLIPAHYLTELMNLLEEVKLSQPDIGALYVYPETVTNKKDEKGVLKESLVEWKPYSQDDSGAHAFFKASEQPLPIATRLTVLSERALFSLMRIHSDNIKAGLAKKVEDLKTADIFKDGGKL